MPDMMYVIPREESNLREYIDNDTPEGRYLEFKSGRLLGDKNKDRIRRDLSKDICGLANAGGGVIVIGIREEGKEPSYAGRFEFPAVEKSAEWLEKILVGCAQPSIVGLEIFDQSVDKENCIIIHVPYSFSAPHQALDKIYYARRNFQNEAMEHYEIEDVRSRQSRKNVSFIPVIKPCGLYALEFISENVGSEPIFNIRYSLPDDVRRRSGMENTSAKSFGGFDGVITSLNPGCILNHRLGFDETLYEMEEFNEVIKILVQYEDRYGALYQDEYLFFARDFGSSMNIKNDQEKIAYNTEKISKHLERIEKAISKLS